MHPNPTLDQLQIFLTVVDSGSFSAAGRKLNRAQSVISYAIGNLESQLGFKLFDRGVTREPILTPAGKATLEDARRMTAVLQNLRARAETFRQGVEPEVAIAVDSALPSPVLIRVLKAFEVEYPNVSLRLSTGNLGATLDEVSTGRADLGVGGMVDAANVRSRKIGFTTMVPAASPDHPLAKLPRPVPLDILREYTQLVVTDLSERTRGRDYGVFAYRTWRMTDLRAKHAMMREGLGWGGLPRWLMAEDLATGRLVELDLEPYEAVTAPLFAMHLAERNPGPAMSWLMAELQRVLSCFNEAEPGSIRVDPLDRGPASVFTMQESTDA